MFSIEVLPGSEQVGDGCRLGRIRVGTFTERFVVAALPGRELAALAGEWHRALRGLLDRAESVALRTQPGEVWVLYRHGTRVFVQSQLLVPGWQGRLANDGSVLEVPPRETVSEHGAPISEWETSVDAVREFVRRFDSPV